jgi:hypothetical protein
LNESKHQIVLRLRFDGFVQVRAVVVVVESDFANIPHAALNLIQQLAPTFEEHVPNSGAMFADGDFRDTDSCAKHVGHLSCVSKRQAAITTDRRLERYWTLVRCLAVRDIERLSEMSIHTIVQWTNAPADDSIDS